MARFAWEHFDLRAFLWDVLANGANRSVFGWCTSMRWTIASDKVMVRFALLPYIRARERWSENLIFGELCCTRRRRLHRILGLYVIDRSSRYPQEFLHPY